jgi:hypothetical protein
MDVENEAPVDGLEASGDEFDDGLGDGNVSRIGHCTVTNSPS